MTHILDLRGDWAARPTQEMRRAMADAEVGDDNSQEDPTVIKLEERSAELMGKEAGLFVPSGTMGNLVSIMALAPYGCEIIAGEQAHSMIYEVGGYAAIGGHPVRTVPNDRFGMMDPDAVRGAIRPDNIHFPTTGLLLLENTHNLRGGTVLSVEQMRELSTVAHDAGFPVHLDGSRIFNAAASLGVPARDVVADVDTLTFCLSKALAAPVGSMVVGSREQIDRARQARKLLGGGMRQAGVIAAAGFVALETMIDRIPEDHANARKLAYGLADIPGFTVDLETVQSNLVFADLSEGKTGPEIGAALEQNGVRINVFGPERIRFALHYEISSADVDQVIDQVRQLV
ncbi:MAG: GntG family PLP-dependent aldolase [Thermomicrobiaceae bacterium]